MRSLFRYSPPRALLLLFFGLGFFLTFSVTRQNQNPSKLSQKQHIAATQSQTAQVLGDKDPKVFISRSDYGYGGGGGVVEIASTDEPYIKIGGYNVSGKVEITVYKADIGAVFEYLIHDKDGKQLGTSPNTANFPLVTKVTKDMNTINNGTPTKVVLPLEEKGVWYVTANYAGSTDDSFIIRSNIGSLVKEGDNEFIFWGQDFRTKRSINNGNITIYNLEGSRKDIASTSFDSSGIAKTTLSNDADIAYVTAGDDLAIVPLNLRYLNSGYSYKIYTTKQRQTRFFTFTDRPLYKPGDTIYFKSIIRDDDDARYTVPSGIADVRISDGTAENSFVYQKSLSISSDGTVNGEYKLPETAKTGYYSLTVSVSETGKSYTSFQVDFFRKPEYYIDVNAPKTDFIAGDNTNITISGNYFSGQPLTGQKIKYKVYSSNYYQYEYVMDQTQQLSDDYRYGYWGGDIITSGELTLNEKGEAQLPLNLKVPDSRKSNQVLSIEAETQNETGNPSFAKKNILVYAGEFDIFRKDYSGYSAKVNNPVTIPLKLVPHAKNDVGKKTITATIVREEWVPYQEPDKKYPSYKKVTETLPKLTAVSDIEGVAQVTFTPTKPGSYVISTESMDARGNKISKDFYSYVSKDNEIFYTESSNNLSLKIDSPKANPGNTIGLTIYSQIPDRDIFLSLERKRVNRFQIVHLSGNSATVNIPIQGSDIPNIFAKASSFSDMYLDDNSIDIPVLSDSKKVVVNITPDRKTYGPSDEISIDVKTTDPLGNPLSADVALWSVDKALFELVDAKPEKIFEAFWKARYNETTQSHSLEGINIYPQAEMGGCFDKETKIRMSDGSLKSIEEIKIGEEVITRESEKSTHIVSAKVTNTHKTNVSGYLIINGTLKITTNHKILLNNMWQEANMIELGDKLLGENGKTIPVTSIEWLKGNFEVYNLTIEKYQTYFADGYYVHNQKGNARTVFKDTAYWNPDIHTNANGEAKVTFKLPDNLTTWVIAGIADTIDTKVGQNTQEIIVTKSVIVRPVLPNILREGDEVIVSSLVQNFSDQKQKFNITASFDSGKLDRTEVSSEIPPGGTKEFFWKIHPDKENDKAKFTVSAKSATNPNAQDTIVSEIPVRIFGFFEEVAQVGDGSKKFNVSLSPDADKQKSEITLSLSPSIIGALPKAMEYLIGYPYGCVEQTTSRFVPAVIALTNRDLYGDALKNKNITDILNKGVARLKNLQKPDGGWTWWFSGDSDIFVTSYVVEFLLGAQKVGIQIDPAILSNARNYIETVKPNETSEDKVVRNYALTIIGSGKRTRISSFDGLTPDILSLAVISNSMNGDKNPNTNGLAQLLKFGKSQGENLYWEEGNKVHFASKDASTALALKAIIQGGGDRTMAAKAARYLTHSRQFDYWSNTFGTAQVIDALTKFSRTGDELTPNYSYRIDIDGTTLSTGTVTGAKQNIKDVSIPVSKIKTAGSVVAVTKTGDGQLYTTFMNKLFHTDRNSPAQNRGLAVDRQYINEKGPEYPLAVGDQVTVKITVSGLSADEYYGIIEDQLPSGMIPVNESFKNEQFGQQYNGYNPDGVSDRDVTENGMVVSLYKVYSREQSYTYKARVISAGTFSVPPAVAALMYSPEVSGRSKADTVKIVSKNESTPLISQIPGIPQKIAGYQMTSIIAGVIVLILVSGILIFLKKKYPLKKSSVNPPDDTASASREQNS